MNFARNLRKNTHKILAINKKHNEVMLDTPCNINEVFPATECIKDFVVGKEWQQLGIKNTGDCNCSSGTLTIKNHNPDSEYLVIIYSLTKSVGYFIPGASGAEQELFVTWETPKCLSKIFTIKVYEKPKEKKPITTLTQTPDTTTLASESSGSFPYPLLGLPLLGLPFIFGGGDTTDNPPTTITPRMVSDPFPEVLPPNTTPTIVPEPIPENNPPTVQLPPNIIIDDPFDNPPTVLPPFDYPSRTPVNVPETISIVVSIFVGSIVSLYKILFK